MAMEMCFKGSTFSRVSPFPFVRSFGLGRGGLGLNGSTSCSCELWFSCRLGTFWGQVTEKDFQDFPVLCGLSPLPDVIVFDT